MSYTLKHTAEAIDGKLKLINENKNLLPYPYDSTTPFPASLEDVGDGSFLTTGETTTEPEIFLNDCSLAGGTYVSSLTVTNIVDSSEDIENPGFSLKIVIDGVNQESSFTIDKDATKAAAIYLVVPANCSTKNLLIKPMIEKGTESTTWVPYMGNIGTYVDERFNSTNVKIAKVAEDLKNINNNLGAPIPVIFEQGGFESEFGTPLPRDNRIRSRDFVEITSENDIFMAVIPDGFEVWIYFYDKNAVYRKHNISWHDISWEKGKYQKYHFNPTLEDRYLKFVLRRSDDTNISPINGKDFKLYRLISDLYKAPIIDNSWEKSMIMRCENMLKPAVARASIPSLNGGADTDLTQDDIIKGDFMTGVNYSSMYPAGRLVGHQVLLSTYYSALENPASKMYTENFDNGSNRSSYYGTVCTGFVLNAIGDPIYRTTRELAEEWEEYKLPINDETDLYKVKRGDILLNAFKQTLKDETVGYPDNGHIKIVKDIIYNTTTGEPYGFYVADSWKPYVRDRFLTAKEFMEHFTTEYPRYSLVSIDKIDTADKDKSVEEIRYSHSIYPDKGDKAIYTPSDDGAWFYIKDDSTKLTFHHSTNGIDYIDVGTFGLDNLTRKEVTVNDKTYEVYASNDSAPDAGYYRIFGNNSDDYCEVTCAFPGKLSIDFTNPGKLISTLSDASLDILEPVYAIALTVDEIEAGTTPVDTRTDYPTPNSDKYKGKILMGTQLRINDLNSTVEDGKLIINHPVEDNLDKINSARPGLMVRLFLKDKNGSLIHVDSNWYKYSSTYATFVPWYED